MDPAAKKQLWSEVAHVREEALDDKKAAALAWRAVLDIDEADPQALRQLARLYEQAGRWQELAVVLETQVRHAEGGDADNVRRTLKTKLARLYAGPLASLDQAVEAYRDVLDLSPGDESILTALEDVHTQREDWLAVQEVLVTRLGNATATDRKIAILAKLAQLAEKQRDSIEEAVQYWHQALDVDPHSGLALAELERLLELGERWHDLIEVFTKRADLAKAAGDKEGEVASLVRAADVWERRLENAEAATEILERILAANPRYVPALTTLARIYEGAGDWDRCLQTLSRAVELAPGGKAAADLYFRLGQVEAARSGDSKAADNYYHEALKYDPGHKDSLVELEKAARERGDHAEVASILSRREMETTDPKQKLALCVELADLYVNKLGQAHAAVPYLERAAQAAPEDPKVLEPLADAYFAAGRTAEATPLYERLLQALKGKRGKEVARLQYRLGAIKQKAGDLPGALLNLEEAYRIDTSHIPTMAALGQIYFEQGEWEKARRVYRSLLLQNLDTASGVSKADVYHKLGLIHAKLGEGPKAKNMYERGLELEPAHAGIKQAMTELT
jgi:tetratricopeptide (TPR) repeat protein